MTDLPELKLAAIENQFFRASTLIRHGPLSALSELMKAPVAVCPGCARQLAIGEYFALVPIGPGLDKAERDNCRAGRAYKAISLPVHWDCATGGA